MPYASVYPLVTARAVAREFTYEVPADVAVGAIVRIIGGSGAVLEVEPV